MKIATLTHHDLHKIGQLQPEGWPDIVTDFRFYLDSGFSISLKVVMESRIVGLGAVRGFSLDRSYYR